jgi:hypothetical protein
MQKLAVYTVDLSNVMKIRSLELQENVLLLAIMGWHEKYGSIRPS